MAQYDGCTDAGAKGGFLRREGSYSSHVTEWRRATRTGSLAGLVGTPRPIKQSAEQLELDKLRRCNERLERELTSQVAVLRRPQHLKHGLPFVHDTVRRAGALTARCGQVLARQVGDAAGASAARPTGEVGRARLAPTACCRTWPAGGHR